MALFLRQVSLYTDGGSFFGHVLLLDGGSRGFWAGDWSNREGRSGIVCCILVWSVKMEC